MYDKVVQVGLRSMDSGSAKKINRKQVFTMSDMRKYSEMEIARKIVAATGKEVYITIDLDVFDPSEMPSVGTPEPDGMRFSQVVSIVEEISKSKRLVGIDIVELSPIPYLTYPNFTAAKLAYLILGYFLARKKG